MMMSWKNDVESVDGWYGAAIRQHIVLIRPSTGVW